MNNAGGFGISASQPPSMPSTGQPFAPLMSPQQPSGILMSAPLISSSPAAFNSSSPFTSLSSSGSRPPLVSMPSPSQQQAISGMGMGSTPGVAGSGMGAGAGVFGAGMQQQPAVDPLSVLDEAFVPLESIQPGEILLGIDIRNDGELFISF